MKKTKTKGLFCCICDELIVKYQLDLGDTVCLDIKGKWRYVCEDCSYKIAKRRIER